MFKTSLKYKSLRLVMHALGAPKQSHLIAPFRHFIKSKVDSFSIPLLNGTLLGENNFTITKSGQGHCTNYSSEWQ